MNPFATVSKPKALGQKSPKSPLTERKEQLDSTSLPCTPIHRPQACAATVVPTKNDRFPFNIRDTVDWIIGYVALIHLLWFSRKYG
ncbi:unnamed protein product [Bursaphelenchus okinawaensis]|uniref:Uncharacterized protein n=1 Tax=Bursaphelenchus okinawaensis TaxID=465554 RepID=A0A811KQU3_9BILA|nr:unnamed protein product [Bursaphelenchus okinawaensis]CAG9108266.1 unnamed protein product [Bursaphelenchus okinawaensis]